MDDTLNIRDTTTDIQFEQPTQLALVVAWCTSEPWRAGTVVLIPARGMLELGREDPTERPNVAQFLQQRPGQNIPCPPLADRWISRCQLQISRLESGDLLVENLGRCPMAVNGHRTNRAKVKPGDLIILHKRLLLWCAKRPALLSSNLAPVDQRMHAFGDPDASGIVGEGPKLWSVRHKIRQIAPKNLHVLIQGESGTGKELVAQAIHEQSKRSGRPMIARNAATLPDSLMDAELFGNAANYPNPGMRARSGLIGEAGGSTLFLDEIGELPEMMQAHLLRVMDGGEYHRLGESEARKVDLRLIAATNRASYALKHDFLARFTLHLQLPPLRARREDIPVLIRFILGRMKQEHLDVMERFLVRNEISDQPEPRISLSFVASLMLDSNPLNVRGLRKRLWDSLLSSPGTTMRRPKDIDPKVAPETPRRNPDNITAEDIHEAMALHHGVKERVWRELGLKDRYALRRLIKKYEKQGHDFSSD